MGRTQAQLAQMGQDPDPKGPNGTGPKPNGPKWVRTQAQIGPNGAGARPKWVQMGRDPGPMGVYKRDSIYAHGGYAFENNCT